MSSVSQEYQPSSSAFLISSYPAKLAWKLVKDGSTYEKAGGTLLSYVAVPLSIAATPVTIVADAVVGAIESSIAGYKHSFSAMRSIAYKKMIVSPVQQIIYAVSGVVSVAAFLFPISYSLSKKAVKVLPACMSKEQFNIFSSVKIAKPSVPQINPLESKSKDPFYDKIFTVNAYGQIGWLGVIIASNADKQEEVSLNLELTQNSFTTICHEKKLDKVEIIDVDPPRYNDLALRKTLEIAMKKGFANFQYQEKDWHFKTRDSGQVITKGFV